jgi:hypothetical protein
MWGQATRRPATTAATPPATNPPPRHATRARPPPQLGSAEDGASVNGATRVGAASAWVSLGSAWLCSILYFWTLVAPWCFPDRDFGHGEVDFD